MLRAHHKIESAFYDTARQFTLKGTISRVDWQNPHVFVYISVSDSTGKLQEWSLEGKSAAVLMQSGWTSQTFKPGDTVIVRGFAPRLRPDLLMIGGSEVELPDGRTLQLGADLN
jgi:hypothetical protein